AGMTRLPGRQASVALNAIGASAEFSNSGGSTAPLGLPSPSGNGGDAGGWAAVPNAYLTWQMAPQFWFGLGLSVPFGLKTEYDQGWVGRFQSQKSEIKTVDINPSVAFKVNEALSLGAGLSYQRAEVKVDRSVILAPPLESRARIDIDDSQWGFNLGVLVNLGASTRIGLTYRSTMDYDLTGSITFTNVPVLGTATNGVRANAELPDTLSWAIAHAFNPRWEMLADITYTRWSKIKAVPLVTTSGSPIVPAAGVTLDTFNFQFKDSYRVGIGANYKWSEAFTLKLGAAYDKSPVEDRFRLTFLPDSDRTWLAIGGRYRMSKQATLDFGYAHLFVKDGAINQQRGVAALPLQGNVIGVYDNYVNIVSAQFTYAF
ncbi:MAG TPA: outer membrane protein transport protein, partial [Burkholderiales bacterium]|nr:outer membrane protein transport protein [Burkholderiales bacterium]